MVVQRVFPFLLFTILWEVGISMFCLADDNGHNNWAASVARNGDPIPPQVEYMYVKGLEFLRQAQRDDGTFAGTYGDDPAAAAFCLMAVLAHGDDPVTGSYAQLAQKALNYILSQQDPESGYIGDSMYSHGFATLALAETYGMLLDDRIGPALQKAVSLILQAQNNNPVGAWRYTPDSTDADASVTGCILVSLYAAANAGIGIPKHVFDKGLKFMASCRNDRGIYGYMTPGDGSIAMSAIGLLTQALGQQHQTQEFQQTLHFLEDHLEVQEDTYPHYLEYYMAQSLFHARESLWRKWNHHLCEKLAATQAPDGSWTLMRSPGYETAFVLLSLAVNYRFLPIYEK